MCLTFLLLPGQGTSKVVNGETALLATVGAIGGAWKYYVRPELTAERGWLAVGAVVLGHELLCGHGETLSEGVDKALEKHPVAVTLAVGTVALHLLNVLPEKLDPLHQAHRLLKPLVVF